ncbi:MAG TPA: DUF4412 domain-containing protein [Polyangia bacterium]|nr:DUF4412 domain-containing protein [Polyangia bacterium]
MMAAVAVSAGLAAAAAPARAGVTIVFQHGTSPPMTMAVDGDKIHVNSPDREAKTTSVIIDAAAKKMTVLDDRAKTYTEITEADVKRIRGQAAAMRGQLEQRMAAMPPEQRQQMQAMLDKMAGAGAEPAKPVKHTFKFESLGQKKTVNGMSCQMYKVLRDGKAHEEDCISPWSAGLLKKDDVEGLRKFGEEMVSNMGMTDGHARQAFDGIDQYPGVPISRVALNDDGSRGDEDQVKSITRGSIPASRFAVPAGYTKKDLSALAGGGMHQP